MVTFRILLTKRERKQRSSSCSGSDGIIRVVKIPSMRNRDGREAFVIMATQNLVFKDLKHRNADYREEDEPEYMRATIHPDTRTHSPPPPPSQPQDPSKNMGTPDHDVEEEDADWRKIEFASKEARDDDHEVGTTGAATTTGTTSAAGVRVEEEEGEYPDRPIVADPEEAATFYVYKHGNCVGAVSFRPVDYVTDPEQRRRMARAIMKATVRENSNIQQTGSTKSRLVVFIPKMVTQAETKAADSEMMSATLSSSAKHQQKDDSTSGKSSHTSPFLTWEFAVSLCAIILIVIGGMILVRIRNARLEKRLLSRSSSTYDVQET